MTSPELERLVLVGQLKREPGTQGEIDGLVRSARSRLTDAGHPALALESRFDLAYNAAHALSLAALRWRATVQKTATLPSRHCPTRSVWVLEFGGCLPPATNAAMRSNMRDTWKWMSVSWPISFTPPKLSMKPCSGWGRSQAPKSRGRGRAGRSRPASGSGRRSGSARPSA
jgi:hypothetical protein